jgi:hypothetical protein
MKSSIWKLLFVIVIFAPLVACLEQGSNAFERSYSRLVEAARPQPYVVDGPYADVLAGCMVVNTGDDSCAPSTLPPLGYPDLAVPSVQDIMERVLVTHDWMGERFEVLLHDMPDDMRYLFRSVTAITIGANIRPSYYSAWRGAIFLDPNQLWLTPEERAEIDLSPDFRSNFGADLQFSFPWRYVKDNDYAYESIPVGADEVSERGIDDIYLSLARLLYHELAHAVDYLSPARLPSISPNAPLAYSVQPSISDLLAATYPLTSEVMLGLAGVRYLGNDSTAEQRAYSPADVAAFFAGDRAAHFYSYTTSREDQAMLFEALMSKYHFDMEMDVAFADPLQDGESSADLILAWGERNRFAHPDILPRAAHILEVMLPEMDFSEWLSDQPGPISLVPGASWHDNLDPATLSPEASPRLLEDEEFRHSPTHRHH